MKLGLNILFIINSLFHKISIQTIEKIYFLLNVWVYEIIERYEMILCYKGKCMKLCASSKVFSYFDSLSKVLMYPIYCHVHCVHCQLRFLFRYMAIEQREHDYDHLTLCHVCFRCPKRTYNYIKQPYYQHRIWKQESFEPC